MKQWRIRTLALLLMLALALSLSACGGSSDIGRAFQNAQASLANVTSMSYDMTMDMELFMTGASTHIGSTATVEYILEPMTAKVDMTINMGDLADDLTSRMYLLPEDGQYYLYTGYDLGDGSLTWQKMEVPASVNQQYDAAYSLDQCMANAESFVAGETELINGEKAVRYDGVIAREDMVEMLTNSGALNQFMTLDVTEEEINAMAADFSDMPVSIWISTSDQLPVRYQLDMTDIMDHIFDATMSVAVGDPDIEVTDLIVTMTVTAYNNISRIDLPADIKL